MSKREELIRRIEAYIPVNAQETEDRLRILDFLQKNEDAFLRTNRTAHMTASAWVVNPERTKVLMAYHRIYDSWAWLGGHADGEEDLLAVAVKEVREESGVHEVHPVNGEILSLEVLPVFGHEKRGVYVSSHLHMNVTYLLEVDDRQGLFVNPEENSAVGWFRPEEALAHSTEPWFVERIYRKLNAKVFGA